ncbi:hypothetical protein OIV53_31660 [Burkholderia pseudomallei]|nr:hypothetical protein [Burkholderia pseudomallei]MCW0066511.1 hypothetical protein [Burkholderia pseudomallei]
MKEEKSKKEKEKKGVARKREGRGGEDVRRRREIKRDVRGGKTMRE